MNLEQLAAEAAELKADLESQHGRLTTALANAAAGKLPQINTAWLTNMRGCVATALSHAHLHLQSVNKKVEDSKTPPETKA